MFLGFKMQVFIFEKDIIFLMLFAGILNIAYGFNRGDARNNNDCLPRLKPWVMFSLF